MERHFSPCGRVALGLLLALGTLAWAGPMEDADALFSSALKAYGAGSYEAALDGWLRAHDLYSEAKSDAKAAKCLYNAGQAHSRLGHRDDEIAAYQRALALYERLAMGPEQAGCHYNLGLCFYNRDGYGQAATHFRAAMLLYTQSGDAEGEADSATNLAVACDLLDSYQEAVELQNRAVAIYERLGRERQVADCWANLGVAYYHLGQFERAIEHHNKALDVYSRLDVPDMQAACWMNLGATYDDLGLYQKGRESSARAKDAYAKLGDRRKQAECTANIGVAYYLEGRHASAIDYLGEALKTYRELGLPRQEANCLANLASARGNSGDTEGAIALHREALLMYTEIGDAGNQARCWTNLACELLSARRTGEALAALDRATRLYRSFARVAVSSGRRWIPSSLYAVDACYGDAYMARDRDGDLFRAYRHYARAIAMVEQLRERAASSTDLKASYFARLSWIYDRMVELLVEMKRRNLQLRPELLREQDAEYFPELGLRTPELWVGWRDYDEAVLHFSDCSRARVLQELLGNRQVAFADTKTEELYRSWTELVARERGLQKKLTASPEAVGAQGESVARLDGVERERRRVEAELFSTAWGRVARPDPATIATIGRSLASGEALVEYKVLWNQLVISVVTPADPDHPDARTVTALTIPTAAGEQRPLWGDGQELRGDVVLQRLEELTASLPDQQRAVGLGPDELAANFSIAELVWLFRRPMAAAPTGLWRDPEQQALQARVGAALYDLLLRPLQPVLDQHDVRSLIVVADGALCYLPFCALVSRLPKDLELTAAGQVAANPELQYALERWSISYLPSVAMHLATRFAHTTAGHGPARLCAFADPVFPGDPRGEPVVASADAGRQAPVNDARAALDALAQIAARAAGAGAAILARLPNTRQEARIALEGFGAGEGDMFESPTAVRWGRSIALVGLAAQEPMAYSPQLRRYGYVLLSTHGVIDLAHPEYSYIALSGPASGAAASSASDGRLMMPEAFGLSLNARMVTLSACRTAEGDYKSGEGILGLTAAMFVSGAQAVTASLWPVEDVTTARLIGDYHRRMGAGEPPAAALRAAQTGMLCRAREAFIEDPGGDAATQASPLYWAPFVMLGEWR